MSAVPPPIAEKKSSAGKVVAFIGCGCLALVALVVAAVFVIIAVAMGAVKKSEVYTETVALVQTHPEAVALLGEPIKPGWFISGSISTANGEGTADFTIPVSGPQGSASLRVVAERPLRQSWQYSVRQLVMDDGTVVDLE